MLLAALLRPGAAPPPDQRGAPALAAASMSPVERQRLRRALEELAARLETRSHPLTEDFEDAPVDAELRKELGTALPKLTAARALVGDASRRCVDPWARGGTKEQRKARYAAWPVSGSALLRFADARHAEGAAEKLRARAAERDSRIALVVGARVEVDAELARELVKVRAAAARAAELLGRSGEDERARALLEEVAQATMPEVPGWLHVGGNELLVVPRLGTVAALDAFVGDVAAHAAGAEWLERPRPLD